MNVGLHFRVIIYSFAVSGQHSVFRLTCVLLLGEGTPHFG